MAEADPLSELATGIAADHVEKKRRGKINVAAPDVQPDEQESLIVQRIETLTDDAEIDTKTLVGDLRDFVLDIIRTRPKLWGQMGQDEQSDIARGVEYAVKEVVGRAVDLIRSDGMNAPIKALLEGYQEKTDGTIKATLKIKTSTDDEAAAAINALHACRGKMLLMTKASAEDYGGQRRDVETMPDQTGLDFEAGDDMPY